MSAGRDARFLRGAAASPLTVRGLSESGFAMCHPRREPVIPAPEHLPAYNCPDPQSADRRPSDLDDALERIRRTARVSSKGEVAANGRFPSFRRWAILGSKEQDGLPRGE